MGEKNYSIIKKLLLDGKENTTTETERPDKTRFWTFNKNERPRIDTVLRKHSILLFITACGIIIVLTLVSMFAFHESTRKSHEDLINVTTENTMSIVNLQSIQHKLGKKTDELEKKLNIIEEKTSFLQYEYADLKKKTKKNENLIGNLQDKNNDLVSKIDTLERTMVEVKRQLHEMQHYMYSTYSKISYNGTDHLRKPPAWTTILMEIVSFIILYYGYF